MRRGREREGEDCVEEERERERDGDVYGCVRVSDVIA